MIYDLTVVGAGLVGATTALALAQAGMRVRLMDAQAQTVMPSAPDLRVVALNLQSIDWLRNLGLWDALDSERIGTFESLAIDDQGKELCFRAGDQGLAKLGVIVENNHLIAKAQAACVADPRISVEFSSSFTYSEEDPCLIIAADGAQSPLRQALNIPCFKHDYDQKAYVAYLTLEKPHRNQAWQIFLPTGPLAFLPMADPHRVSMVWTLPRDDSKEITAEAIGQASDYHFGSVTLSSSVVSFPLRLQLSDQYFKNHCVFVGDAIHSIHPLAGQGVNLGFGDAQALVRLLSTHKPTDWTKPLLLKRYQRERKSPNLTMAHAMSVFNVLFRQENPCIVKARHAGITCLDHFSPLKCALSRNSGSK